MRTPQTLSVFLFAALLSLPLAAVVDVGDIAPDFQFNRTWNMPQEATSLASLRGQLVLVETWATW